MKARLFTSLVAALCCASCSNEPLLVPAPDLIPLEPSTGSGPESGLSSSTGAAAQEPGAGKTGPVDSTGTGKGATTSSAPGPGASSGSGATGTGVFVPPFPPHLVCVGQKDGTLCGHFVVCMQERCMPSVCGDGFVHPGHEECEDGNQEENDGCDACLLERCGDGLLQPWEACDDGNNIDEDDCDAQCRKSPYSLCGNGLLDGKEECDDGNTVHDDGCGNDCRRAAGPACGNGILDPGESCDDGNHRVNDGCGPSCQIERCGDGFIRPATEQCDDGNLDDGDGCSASCEVEYASCGNGRVEGAEECDDGNNQDADDCPNSCRLAVCGDGLVQGRESCDDGNQQPGDGCSERCTKETQCGNGIVEYLFGQEHCDDGNNNNFDRCPNNCQFPWCGDGVQAGPVEACDGDDTPFEGQRCDERCRILPVCGNGVLESSKHYPDRSETCDDGNTEDGDGCSSSCQRE